MSSLIIKTTTKVALYKYTISIGTSVRILQNPSNLVLIMYKAVILEF